MLVCNHILLDKALEFLKRAGLFLLACVPCDTLLYVFSLCLRRNLYLHCYLIIGISQVIDILSLFQ